MKSKIIPAILVLIIVFAAFGGDKPGEVSLWDFRIHDKPYRLKMFKKFNKEHPNVEIKYTSMGEGMIVQMLNLAFKTHKPPDILSPIGQLSLIKLMDLGWIIPLDDIAPNPAVFAAWKARFPAKARPFVEGINMFKGKVYSFPWGGSIYSPGLFYNKTLFRKAGIVDKNGEPTPPTNWSEFREYAKRITKAGKGRYYGAALMAKEPTFAFEYGLLSATARASGYYHSTYPNNLKTGRYDYSSPILRKAIQLWIDLKNDGSLYPGAASLNDEAAKQAFALDRVAMIFGGYWVVSGAKAFNPECDFDVTMVPIMDGAKRIHPRLGGAGGGSSYVVSKPCSSPDAIWKVIDLLSSKEFHEGWVKSGGGVSVFYELNKPEYFPHPAMGRMARWTQEYITKLGPIVRPEARRITDYMEPVHPDIGNTILGIFLGRVGFDALDDLEQRMNAAFDSALEKARKDGLNITRKDFMFPDYDWTKDEDYVPKK